MPVEEECAVESIAGALWVQPEGLIQKVILDSIPSSHETGTVDAEMAQRILTIPSKRPRGHPHGVVAAAVVDPIRL
jgi:hypothetical protein